jgi:predicted RNA methylase
MKNFTGYLGLIVILIGALVMLVAYIMGNLNNTALALGAGLGVLGLLIQVFLGRAADY